LFATSVVYTGGKSAASFIDKFATGINNSLAKLMEKFAADVVDINFVDIGGVP
jgi:hypothetical protein